MDSDQNAEIKEGIVNQEPSRERRTARGRGRTTVDHAKVMVEIVSKFDDW